MRVKRDTKTGEKIETGIPGPKGDPEPQEAGIPQPIGDPGIFGEAKKEESEVLENCKGSRERKELWE